MNYASNAVQSAQSPQEMPITPQIVEKFDANLSSLWSSIDLIENRCHKLLNLRTPTEQGKEPVPMENDFVQQIGNRLVSFSKANERLSEIVNHLDKIV